MHRIEFLNLTASRAILSLFLGLSLAMSACTTDEPEPVAEGEVETPAEVVGEEVEEDGETTEDAGEDTPAEDESATDGDAPELDAPPTIEIKQIDLKEDGESEEGEGTQEEDTGEVVEIPSQDHALLGSAAPDFSLENAMTGETITLSELKGKTVLLNYWATWCIPCRQEMPWMQSVYEKYKDQGFEILAIDTLENIDSADVPERVKQFGERMDLSFPLVLDLDDAVAESYTVSSALPISFFVDVDGNVAHHHVGKYENEASLDNLVRQQMGLDEAE